MPPSRPFQVWVPSRVVPKGHLTGWILFSLQATESGIGYRRARERVRQNFYSRPHQQTALALKDTTLRKQQERRRGGRKKPKKRGANKQTLNCSHRRKRRTPSQLDRSSNPDAHWTQTRTPPTPQCLSACTSSAVGWPRCPPLKTMTDECNTAMHRIKRQNDRAACGCWVWHAGAAWRGDRGTARVGMLCSRAPSQTTARRALPAAVA